MNGIKEGLLSRIIKYPTERFFIFSADEISSLISEIESIEDEGEFDVDKFYDYIGRGVKSATMNEIIAAALYATGSKVTFV